MKSYYLMSLCTKDLNRKWNRIEALLVVICDGNGIKKLRRRVQIQLFLYRNDDIRVIRYGDIFKVDSSTLRKIVPTGEYVNYQRKLLDDGILFQDFVYPKSITYVCNEPDNRIMRWFSILNFDLKRRLKKFIKDNDDASLACSIILGRKENSDSSIFKVYNKAGVSHFVAISGLHINFLIFIVNMVLSLFIRSNRAWMKFLKRVIMLISVWFYTVLIGVPPSALRAATMTSFFLLFKFPWTQRELLRRIFVSLFTLVLFYPRLLFSIGAQLSYCAMFGISLIFFNIVKVFKSRIFIVRYLFTTVILSFSVYVFTLPLLVYYFSQLSSYSFICNLVIVPLGGIIFGLGLLTILTSFCDERINQIVAFVLSSFLHFINMFIIFISELPGSVIYF